MDGSSEHQHLLAALQAAGDAGYQAGSQMVTKSGLRIYGVRVPVRRQIARDWQQDHPQTPWPEVLALVESLWLGESLEERSLAILLLERYKRHIPRLAWDHFNRWRRLLDNWEVTDGLATAVFGPWIIADPANRQSHLEDLIADQDVWSRRLALVATVPMNRSAKTGRPDLTFELIEQVKAERHPMITKAVSWALRTMIKIWPERVTAYLEANRDTLAGHVAREVDNKLTTGLKSGKDSSGP